MTSISFQNSDEFKSFTSKVCSHLSKTKLNQLRSAIAKEFGHHHLSTFYASLDNVSVPNAGSKEKLIDPSDYETLGFSREQSLAIQKFSSANTPGALIVSGSMATGRSTTARKIFGDMVSLKAKFSDKFHGAVAIETDRESAIPYTTHFNPELDLTGKAFKSVMDSAARNAPDFILLDELKNGLTANKAIFLIQAGFKIVATMRASQSFNILSHLKMMGANHEFNEATFSGFIHQDLVLRLCDHCSLPVDVEMDGKEYQRSINAIVESTGMNKDYSKIRRWNTQGCEHCEGGWTNRTVIAEVVPITDSLINTLTSKGPEAARSQFKASGGTTIEDHAFHKVLAGEVDPANACRHLDLIK